MTIEDAILCLKGIKNYGRDTFTEQSEWQNSLDMAIEALEILSSMPDIEIRRYKEKFKSLGAFKYADTDSVKTR